MEEERPFAFRLVGALLGGGLRQRTVESVGSAV